VIIISSSVIIGTIIVRNNINRAQEADLLLVSDIADHFLSSEIALLKMTAERAADFLVTNNQSGWEDAVLRLESQNGNFIGISVLDSTDGVVASTGELPPQADIMTDRYISQAFHGYSRVSTSIPTEGHGVVFYLAVPVPGYDNKILVFTLPGMFFSDMVSTFTIWDSGHIFVVDAEGTIMANIRPEWVNNRMNFIRQVETNPEFEDVAKVLERVIAGETGLGRFSISNVPRLCAFRPMSGSEEGWFLGIIAPLPESPYRTVDQGLIISGSIGVFLSIIVAIIASTFIKKPFVEVETLKEEAEIHSKFKSDFIANMSHEIRTPMNVILGITEILVHDKSLSTNVSDGLSRIYNSGDLLLGIINDILDLSKIEAGRLELYLANYDTASLINDTAVLHYMRNESKPIEFILSINENIPATLFGDELRIKQILNNLLSNAFKYTEKGEIRLSFDIDHVIDPDDQEHNITLILTVSDTGQGMTKDQVITMFDEFTRFNFEANRTKEGTGLGMSITRNLVSLMNGEITVTSEPNEGSVFTVRLPQKYEGAEVLGVDLVDNLQKFNVYEMSRMRNANVIFEPMPYGKVMVVDDVESNLFVARGLLNPYDLTVETVTSGYNAIEKVEAGNVYDIIFMDHMMPKMDGIEATQKIRDLGYHGTIVALTANALIGQMDIFMQNGFDDFISKPIDVRYLNVVLKKYIQDKQPEDVLEEVRKKMLHSKMSLEQDTASFTISPQLAEFFTRDAESSIKELQKLVIKDGKYDDEDLKSFTITVHAMKNALLNVGEKDLSDLAGRLESAGWRNEKDIINESPAFIDKLKRVISKLAPQDDEDLEVTVTDDDYADLKDKMIKIIDANEAFDNKTAKELIYELREKVWPREIRTLLSDMSEQLLSGDVDGVTNTANTIIDKH